MALIMLLSFLILFCCLLCCCLLCQSLSCCCLLCCRLLCRCLSCCCLLCCHGCRIFCSWCRRKCGHTQSRRRDLGKLVESIAKKFEDYRLEKYQFAVLFLFTSKNAFEWQSLMEKYCKSTTLTNQDANPFLSCPINFIAARPHKMRQNQ